MIRRYSLLMLVALGSSLEGCKYFPAFDAVLQDKKQDYKKAESLPDLEVPPDLSSDAIKDTLAVPEVEEGAASYSTYQDRVAARRKNGAATAPEDSTASAMPAATETRPTELTVRGSKEDIWPKLKAHWQREGYALEVDDEERGQMETAWKENEQGQRRERFQVQVRPDEQGTTRLAISANAEERKGEGAAETWVPVDTRQAAEAVAGLEESLGTSAPVSMVSEEERAAQRAERDRVSAAAPAAAGTSIATLMNAGEGKRYLLVTNDFGSTWKATGEALTQSGITVQDKDESRGVYYIDYVGTSDHKRSLLSRLAFWRGDDSVTKHQVSVTAVGGKTEVVVLDKKGNWENDSEADRILESLQTAMQKEQRSSE